MMDKIFGIDTPVQGVGVVFILAVVYKLYQFFKEDRRTDKRNDMQDGFLTDIINLNKELRAENHDLKKEILEYKETILKLESKLKE